MTTRDRSGGEIATCVRCGLRRGSWRGGSLRRLLRDAGPGVAAAVHEAWPNADLDHAHIRGLVAYSDGSDWTLTRPECRTQDQD